ncbi:MAG: hypothetical protein QXP66_01750 [Candidatus Aenigmatarchaeota archaeon]
MKSKLNKISKKLKENLLPVYVLTCENCFKHVIVFPDPDVDEQCYELALDGWVPAKEEGYAICKECQDLST